MGTYPCSKPGKHCSTSDAVLCICRTVQCQVVQDHVWRVAVVLQVGSDLVGSAMLRR